MNRKSFWRKAYKINKNGFITGIALIFIALAQIPKGIKDSAEIICIGQTSNKIWRQENNHIEANMLAVQLCNGSNNPY